MVPSKTFEVLGGFKIASVCKHDPSDYYALTGIDLNDLAVLSVASGSRRDDS